MSKRKPTIKEILFNRYQKNGISDFEIEPLSNYLEKIIFEQQAFLDKNFIARLNSDNDFADRLYELYFISALKNNNLSLEHKSDAGLDIWINDISGWGEFVCAHNTEEMKKNNILGEARIVDPNETLLRITSVLKTKSDKILDDLSKGRVEDNQPIIIFLSTGQLIDWRPMNPKGDICSFVRAVLPISEPTLMINMSTKESQLCRKYQFGIPKKNVVVENDFFLEKQNELISAVVFSYCSIYNRFDNPSSSFKDGDDFIVVHNPLAKNPIPHRLLKCREEYVCEYEENVSFSIRNIKET